MHTATLVEVATVWRSGACPWHGGRMNNAERFLDGYLKAWSSNDPDTIRDLFAADATYRGGPQDLPTTDGADAIVAMWLNERDEPGTWSYEGAAEVETASAAVIRGVTTYTGGPKTGVYDNVWLVRFDDEGRALEFQDWWFERKN